MRLVDRRIDDHLVVTYAGPNAVYAAAVYQEDWDGNIAIGKEVVKGRTTRLAIGPSIHPIRMRDPERARQLQVLITAAAGLNRAILEIVELEERAMANPKAKRKKRK